MRLVLLQLGPADLHRSTAHPHLDGTVSNQHLWASSSWSLPSYQVKVDFLSSSSSHSHRQPLPSSYHVRYLLHAHKLCLQHALTGVSSTVRWCCRLLAVSSVCSRTDRPPRPPRSCADAGRLSTAAAADAASVRAVSAVPATPSARDATPTRSSSATAAGTARSSGRRRSTCQTWGPDSSCRSSACCSSGSGWGGKLTWCKKEKLQSKRD